MPIPFKYPSRVFLDLDKTRPTYNVFWYPIKKFTVDPKKPDEMNLYAGGGPLQKYDEAFSKKSRQFELENNFQPDDPNIRGWQGMCDQAALVIALLPQEPKKKVVLNGVTFTPSDIKGLLCKSISSVDFDYTFVGYRYPERPRDQQDHPENDPTPSTLYKKLDEWSKLKPQLPIIADVDRYGEVWNYCYSKIEWKLDSNGLTGRVEFSSVGQPIDANKKWYFDLKDDKWVPAPEDEHIDYVDSPDFCWRPVASKDLLKESSWPVENTKKLNPFYNPEVSPRDVYALYIRSIDTDEDDPKQDKE